METYQIGPWCMNDVVAVEPMSEEVMNPKIGKGFAMNRRALLIPLKVVYSNPKSGVHSGMVVYVSGEDTAQPWAKAQYKIGDNEPSFILCPVGRIQLVAHSKAD